MRMSDEKMLKSGVFLINRAGLPPLHKKAVKLSAKRWFFVIGA
jgi:hypothetical protein